MSRYRIGKRPALNRRLGSRERVEPPSAAARGAKDGGMPWDVRWQGPPFPSERVSVDSHARVHDMDLEGVDVNMILPSGGVPAFCALDDAALEQAMYGAYHRFLADYCAPYPDRLTGVLLVSARDPARSVTEIREAVLGWRSISETVRRKLLWDNAAQCYARLTTRRPPPVRHPLGSP